MRGADRYYGLLDQIDRARSDRRYPEALALSLEALGHLPALVRATVREFGAWDIPSVPPLAYACNYLAALQRPAELKRLREFVASMPELTDRLEEIDRALERADLMSRIEQHLTEMPGSLQRNMGRDLGVDGRQVSNLLTYARQIGVIRREPEGRTYRLYFQDAPSATADLRIPVSSSSVRASSPSGQNLPTQARSATAPRLIKSVPERQDGAEAAPHVISLDSLDPVEDVAWEVRGQKLTPPQFLKLLASRGLDIESHPLFDMIMACPERAGHITCNHKSHDSDAKRDSCIRSQAAKLAARSLRHHIGFLYRLDMWSEPRSLMSHAMWSCIERHGPACAACRAREGIVVSVEDKRVPVLHPACNCTLVQLARGQLGSGTIGKTLRYVEARDPERARVMRENLTKSGWGAELGAGCGGCLLPVVFALTGLSVAIWGLARW